MNSTLLSALALFSLLPSLACAVPENRDTDWFKAAQYGIFMHFLPGDDKQFALVDRFDVDALAVQLEAAGAKYFVLTLGQNSGYYNSPNATYDRVTGYVSGERCSRRDLPLELYRALAPKGIRLMLYLPCQVPNEAPRAQKAFGLRQGKQDQPLDLTFATKWAEVIREWADRYGDKVSGWWFDGGYQHIAFNETIAQLYAEAVKHGNPDAIVTFNPGVRVVHYTEAEDYTAGELNEPFDTIPASRWLDGSQWHVLTFLGSTWGQRNTRFPAERWVKWATAVAAKEGVVTLDLGPNYDPQAGPIGSLAPEQLKQVEAIKKAVRASPDAVPRRLKRADSFLGIHFDFHAGPDCTEIGKNTTREMIESVIAQVHPDYIQTDCKGHPGLSSYPTKVGNPAPGFVGDPLRLWREVTAAHGVGLYMHYSGVWDSQAIRLRPDWAVRSADGATNVNATSFFSPYADRLLIPQLRELAGDYRVDGAWVDGECWASMPDFGDAALKAFRETTGIQDVPRKASEPHWYEFLQFNREAFRRYLRYYIAEVKKTNPEMQLCSNWAFTDHMPEAVSAPVDWISGDYSPEDSVNSARLSARYIACQGKPWDLMAWSFTTKKGKDGRNRKSVPQLQREAAVVIALGGGFQAYFAQNRDGSVRLEEIPTMAEVAKFCRARQAICHHAEPVPQVALLYSTAEHYRDINGLFNRDLSRISGTLQALLESQLSVEVLSEHHFPSRSWDHPLIVIPECHYLEPDFKEDLLSYVRAGGNLLLVGPQTAALFQSQLHVTLEGAPNSEPRFLAHANAVERVQGTHQAVRVESDAQPFGRLQSTDAPGAPAEPAASIANLGRGKIAATYFSFSQGYLKTRSAAHRAFLNDLARQLFPNPIVEVKGSPYVDVAVNRLKGNVAINLVNTAGPHYDVNDPILDTIPPIGPLQILIRCEKAPARVSLEPGSEPLKYDFRDGVLRLSLPHLEIHNVILLQSRTADQGAATGQGTAGTADDPPAGATRYALQLDDFRRQHGIGRILPNVPFFQFGMGSRTKYLFKDGRLLEAMTGKMVRTWQPTGVPAIVPCDYFVAFTNAQDARIRLVEDESGVWIHEGSRMEPLPGTQHPLRLPSFENHVYASILRALHHEILMNIVDGRPVPNLYVYKRPWYRDGAMVAMCLKETGNLDLIRDWILNLREVFDRNNAGETEADNPGQVLYLISLVSDNHHPLVPAVLEALKKFEVQGERGPYIKGRSDFAEHPVYQTKWAKFGLRALGLPDPYVIPWFPDSYSSLFWMDYRDQHIGGKEATDRVDYPYLGWATDHFQGKMLGPISTRDYPLTWESKASQADYNGMSMIDPEFTKEKICTPHTWHAAEIFLSLLQQKVVAVPWSKPLTSPSNMQNKPFLL